MASPQEVIELSIPHPADSTPESRRRTSSFVLNALHTNNYYFVRRQLPVLDSDDGQCPTCKCELVHNDLGPAFEDAAHRNAVQEMHIYELKEALLAIIHGADDPVKVATKALLNPGS